MTPPSHVEAWDAIPRDLATNDHSRARGAMTDAERAGAETVTDLGNGLTQTTYVDTAHRPHFLNLEGRLGPSA